MFSKVAMWFLLITASVYATTVMPASVKEAFKWADVVFTGEAVKVQYVDKDSQDIWNEPRIIVTFRVSKIWKGNDVREIVLHTYYNKVSSAGSIFKQGREYLVYAKKEQSKKWLGYRKTTEETGIALPRADDFILATYSGARTDLVVNVADKDFKELDKLKVP